ncbi:sigma 54-interacting transcriptional regulator [Clostridium psychrophilum]|uniref:sigma 54-interacting transcriptional regulator n=1 Tax=Clostridium psychrophilum TaxID=132926 RepID=UPI001C0DE973|nr:sigma 54-interacting transcriptional regulator [Clostridium psychrophilum]MBU3180297.1 sigma 54-interacting transcriptional regulator [Clostridium psychrophilum]
MIENTIFELIDNEDKKIPLTDNDIALKVNTTRAYITQFRKEKRIPNSHQRREEILHNDIKKIIEENNSISDNMLCKMLAEIGYDISRYSVTQIRKQVVENATKSIADNVTKDVVDNATKNIVDTKAENVSINKLNNKIKIKINSKKNINNNLREIIGYHGSLRNQIRQAEAAILYPPHGLHTLILGPSGVGKSFFAEAMYKFAVNSSNFKNNAPFIVFNCADYAENPQLLLSQLFGYVKGAFTGANVDKVGIVEKANDGILFLDEVHRLPSEGQEILFHLLDKGRYRRLGETENSRIANVMITAATTEDPKSALLLTFRRRIPMIIDLPSINDRPIKERYILIENFFSQEAARVGKEITIRFDVIRSLLLYDCPGNIGQLRSDIQVACAKGFLNSLSNDLDVVIIEITDLPDHVPLGILSVASRNSMYDDISNDDLVVDPGNISTNKLKNDRYILPDEIYSNIQEKYYDLEKQGLKTDEINKIIWNKMKFDLNRFAKNIESNILFPKEELKNIIDEKILKVVENVTNIAKSYIDNIKENFYYCVAVHLNSTVERLKQGKIIKNSQLDYIKSEYYNEYRVAKILTKEINKSLDIDLPDDEIGFLAMYIKTFSAMDQNISRVNVIILSHGHVACGMADVSNKLLGTNLAIGIEMSLDESPKTLLEKTIETVKKVNEGKGCLLLVDMGSLVTFGEIITKQTGIPTRIIGRVDTVMVLEAVRRALVTSDLNEIANALDGDKSYVGKVEGVKKYSKTIITVCITGEGTALRIKKYIEEIKEISNENISIIPIGIMDRENAQYKINKISEDHNIIAIVGTINPNIYDIPFISFQSILKEDGKRMLKNLIGIKIINPLTNVIDEGNIQIRDDLFSKGDVIDAMCSLLQLKGNVKEGYAISVYKREMMGGTIVADNVAIPHGLPEHVKKSSLTIFKLKHPIIWDNDTEVDTIIMLALKENDREIVLKLFDLLSKIDIIKKVKQAKSPKEIANIFLNE